MNSFNIRLSSLILCEEFYYTFSLLVAQETKIGPKLGGGFLKVGLPNKTWFQKTYFFPALMCMCMFG